MRATFIMAAAIVCTSTNIKAAEFRLDVRTNFSPATEFRYVRVELIDRRDRRRSWTQVHSATAGEDFVRGARVAHFRNVDKRRIYDLFVQLLDGRTRPVTGRLIAYTAGSSDSFGTTVLFSR